MHSRVIAARMPKVKGSSISAQSGADGGGRAAQRNRTRKAIVEAAMRLLESGGTPVSALCVLIGWEPMIVLKDVRGLNQKTAEDVLAFAVCAVVEKALGEGLETPVQEDPGPR